MTRATRVLDVGSHKADFNILTHWTMHAARGGPPAWMRADESDGDDDSDGDEDSDDGDSSIEAILAEAVQRLRS